MVQGAYYNKRNFNKVKKMISSSCQVFNLLLLCYEMHIWLATSLKLTKIPAEFEINLPNQYFRVSNFNLPDLIDYIFSLINGTF